MATLLYPPPHQGEFKFLNVVTASESDAIAHDTLALAAVSNLGRDISPEAAAAYALGFTAGRDKATLQATTETIAIAVKASSGNPRVSVTTPSIHFVFG